MAIISERFESGGNRNWLSSVHGISNAPTFKCSFVGTVTKDTLIPSGSPVVVKADGTAVVVEPGATVPTLADGDQLGFTVSDRYPDVTGQDEAGTDKLGLNAATLMHGRLRYRFLGDGAKAAVDAISAAGAVGKCEFTIHRQ